MNKIDAAMLVIRSYIEDMEERESNNMLELSFAPNAELITKSVEGKTKRYIRIVTTGIKEDRHGEKMAESATTMIMEAHRSGSIPAFSNHGMDGGIYNRYRWQDIIGKWVDAEKLSDGNIVSTLEINEAHPEADLLCSYVEEGMPIGASIGARALDKTVEVQDDE